MYGKSHRYGKEQSVNSNDVEDDDCEIMSDDDYEVINVPKSAVVEIDEERGGIFF